MKLDKRDLDKIAAAISLVARRFDVDADLLFERSSNQAVIRATKAAMLEVSRAAPHLKHHQIAAIFNTKAAIVEKWIADARAAEKPFKLVSLPAQVEPPVARPPRNSPMQPLGKLYYRKHPKQGVDVTALVCGDPEPGRSALDMKMAGRR